MILQVQDELVVRCEEEAGGSAGTIVSVMEQPPTSDFQVPPRGGGDGKHLALGANRAPLARRGMPLAGLGHTRE